MALRTRMLMHCLEQLSVITVSSEVQEEETMDRLPRKGLSECLRLEDGSWDREE